MIWLALVKTLVVKLVRTVAGSLDRDRDTPIDPLELSITELSRIADDVARPRGPNEPSQPLPYREVERQRAMAKSAARPETARPPPLPEPMCPICEHTLDDFHTCEPREPEPVAEVRTADTVRPGPPRPRPPPRPTMPHSATRAAKRLPPPPRK
jgi:hypothetical protein